MDIELQAKREECENDIQEILREIEYSNEKLDQEMIDQRSYDSRMLFLKQQLSKAQRALDELD